MNFASNTVTRDREDEPQVVYFSSRDLTDLAKQVNAWLGEDYDSDWSIIDSQLSFVPNHGIFVHAITIIIHHEGARHGTT